MKKLVLIALVALCVSGCPEPMNTVLIENNSSFNVVFVGVLISGRQDERVNLLEEGQIVPPGFSEPFCCFLNDFYDIFVLTDEPTNMNSAFTEFRWENQALVGPMTHIFTVGNAAMEGEMESEGAGDTP